MAAVLVADDEPNIRGALSDLLEAADHRVTAVSDGQEVLDRLGGAPLPDLIVLDVNMPVKDGYAVLAELQRDERRRSIPVIVLTCQGRDSRLAATPGVSVLLEKPFDPAKLLEAVGRLLSP